MCKCTPNIKTPFCGKPGCEWPKQREQPPSKEQVDKTQDALGELYGWLIDLANQSSPYDSQMLMKAACIVGDRLAGSAESGARYPHWTCKTHGDFDARVAVGCPECVREMRTTLRGIQSCSTCEACRGAATLVLTNGNQAVASSSGDVVVAPMPRGSLPNSLGVSNDGFSAIAEAVSKADPANYRAQPPGAGQ